jgi:hypothetical protein
MGHRLDAAGQSRPPRGTPTEVAPEEGRIPMAGEFLIALAVALMLTAAFAAFDATGPWAGFWVFFVLVLLVAWAAGVWVRPFGPAVWGIAWAPYLVFGLIAALIVAAAAPARRRSRAAGPPPLRPPTSEPPAATARPGDRAGPTAGTAPTAPAGERGGAKVVAADLGAEDEAVAVGAFAWALVVLLLIVVIVGYVL